MTTTVFEDQSVSTADRPSSFSVEWIRVERFVPDFRRRIQEQLDRLSALPANWDGEGAPCISRETIQAARDLVASLPENIAAAPVVVPMASGHLQFEWNEGSRSLELEFESPTLIRFLRWDPDNGIEDEDSFAASDVRRAEALIRWFLGGSWHAQRD